MKKKLFSKRQIEVVLNTLIKNSWILEIDKSELV